MKKRSKLSNQRSKSMFSKTASRTHKKNAGQTVMRGGIRL